MKQTRLTPNEKKEILQTISSLIYNGTSRGTAIKKAADKLNRPYITVKYHYDKWLKKALNRDFKN